MAWRGEAVQGRQWRPTLLTAGVGEVEGQHQLLPVYFCVGSRGCHHCIASNNSICVDRFHIQSIIIEFTQINEKKKYKIKTVNLIIFFECREKLAMLAVNMNPRPDRILPPPSPAHLVKASRTSLQTRPSNHKKMIVETL